MYYEWSTSEPSLDLKPPQPPSPTPKASGGVRLSPPAVDCRVAPALRLHIILPLPIRQTRRSQMITLDSESKPAGRRQVEGEGGRFCRVPSLYPLTLKRRNHLRLIFFLLASSLSPTHTLFFFLFHSFFCPSITPFLTISPDPMLILILLPHSSITHSSHFCIHNPRRRGRSSRGGKPPICPNIDPPPTPPPTLPTPPNLCHASLIVYDFIFNQT